MHQAPIIHFPDVTVLITHYNRPASLERLLDGLLKLGCTFDRIVVSDDASSAPEQLHLDKLASRFGLTLARTEQNGGLGNNLNKGQDLIDTAYTLYIQEDFVPKAAFRDKLVAARDMMQEDHQWDLVSFYAYFPYPYRIPHKEGFSQKYFPWSVTSGNCLKFYYYSDHPHLRRSSFTQKFGRYNETTNSDRTELEMSLSVIRNEGKVLFFDEHYSLFEQHNPPAEPSTAMFRKAGYWNMLKALRPVKWTYMLYKFFKLTLLLQRTRPQAAHLENRS